MLAVLLALCDGNLPGQAPASRLDCFLVMIGRCPYSTIDRGGGGGGGDPPPLEREIPPPQRACSAELWCSFVVSLNKLLNKSRVADSSGFGTRVSRVTSSVLWFWSLKNLADIFQTTFSNTFLTESIVFGSKFNRSLFLRIQLTKSALVDVMVWRWKATSHHLIQYQRMTDYDAIYNVIRPEWLWYFTFLQNDWSLN